MKKIFAILSCLFLAINVFAGGAVQVDTNTFLVTWPTNLWTANGISQTSTVVGLTTRVATLESLQITDSNALVTATNVTRTVSDRVTILETNTATKAQGIAATNAQARVAVLEASSTYTNAIPYTNGTVYATAYVGSGVGLTGVISAVTGGVNSITMGGSNFVGDLTIIGTGLTYTGPGTATVYRVDYMTRNIALSTNIYEMTMDGPRDEEMTITNIFSKSDAYQCTFDVVSAPMGSTWRADQTTLISGVIASDTGTTTKCHLVIPTNTEWGVKMTDFDPRTTQLRVRYKTVFE